MSVLVKKKKKKEIMMLRIAGKVISKCVCMSFHEKFTGLF